MSGSGPGATSGELSVLSRCQSLMVWERVKYFSKVCSPRIDRRVLIRKSFDKSEHLTGQDGLCISRDPGRCVLRMPSLRINRLSS